jgi:hypothetical protein
MTHYTTATHSYAQATAQLMHAFSAFFESQMQDAEAGAWRSVRWLRLAGFELIFLLWW